MTLSIAIAGAEGRMGRALIASVAQRKDVAIVGGAEREGAAPEAEFPISRDAGVAAANAEVWIDFSAPDATIAALNALASTKVRAAIIGTTGLSAEQEASIA